MLKPLFILDPIKKCHRLKLSYYATVNLVKSFYITLHVLVCMYGKHCLDMMHQIVLFLSTVVVVNWLWTKA